MATENESGQKKKRVRKSKKDLAKSPTLNNSLSYVPSTSSFGGNSMLKPRFMVDPKAREPYKNTNLGNPQILIDDSSTLLS